jgi:vanillate/4-hydroxybenzoate decarboxylase subunit C
MIIDATTPIAPDRRGHYGQELDSPRQTDVWRKKLAAMIKGLQQ